MGRKKHYLFSQIKKKTQAVNDNKRCSDITHESYRESTNQALRLHVRFYLYRANCFNSGSYQASCVYNGRLLGLLFSQWQFIRPVAFATAILTQWKLVRIFLGSPRMRHLTISRAGCNRNGKSYLVVEAKWTHNPAGVLEQSGVPIYG